MIGTRRVWSCWFCAPGLSGPVDRPSPVHVSHVIFHERKETHLNHPLEKRTPTTTTTTRRKKKKRNKGRKNPSQPQTPPKTSSSTTSQRWPSPRANPPASPAGSSSPSHRSPQHHSRSRYREAAPDQKPQSAASGIGRTPADRAGSSRRGCRASGRCRAGGRRARRGVCGGWKFRSCLLDRGRSGWDIRGCFLYFYKTIYELSLIHI